MSTNPARQQLIRKRLEQKENKAILSGNTWDRFANQPRSCSSQFAAL